MTVGWYHHLGCVLSHRDDLVLLLRHHHRRRAHLLSRLTSAKLRLWAMHLLVKQQWSISSYIEDTPMIVVLRTMMVRNNAKAGILIPMEALPLQVITAWEQVWAQLHAKDYWNLLWQIITRRISQFGTTRRHSRHQFVSVCSYGT